MTRINLPASVASKIFPAPCAETATPASPPGPSVKTKSPSNTRTTIEPSPPAVTKSAWGPSSTISVPPSAKTFDTATRTRPTVKLPVLNKLIPPFPARAETLVTDVNNG